MRVLLILATSLSITCYSYYAIAGKPTECIEVAAAFANSGPREIDGWLARYHKSYRNCRAKAPASIEKIKTKKVEDKKPMARVETIAPKSSTPRTPIAKKDVIAPAL